MQLQNEYLDITLKLFSSFVCGGLVGLERQLHGHPAGLKTHILVSVGAALVMLISMKGFSTGDPARLSAQVVSGMGFIGAGAIMHDSMGGIKGITTAASLWITAMLGLACGNGFYFGAGVALVLTIISLVIIRHYEGTIFRKPIIINVICELSTPISNIVLGIINEYNLESIDYSINSFNRDSKKYNRLTITLQNNKKHRDNIRSAISKLRELLDPISFSVNFEDDK